LEDDNSVINEEGGFGEEEFMMGDDGEQVEEIESSMDSRSSKRFGETYTENPPTQRAG
jgi:hypothetical protein